MATDFKGALFEADAELAVTRLSPGAEARLRERLGASLYSQRLWWRYPVTALASCVAGALLVYGVLKPPAPVMLAGMKIETPSAGFKAAAEGDELVVRSGEATVKLEGASVRVTRPGRLRHEERGMRVLGGRVELEVAKRAAEAAPMRVLVSDGEIEVRGTRFAVDQIEGGGGAALLWEGTIVFRAPDGREVKLEPGQSVAWPLPPAPAAKGEPAHERDMSFDAPDEDALVPLPAPTPQGSDWSAHDRLLRAHSLLERVPKLRADGAFHQAAVELEAAMKQDLPAAARERLSWELVDLYANDLWDAVKACRQAKDHLWRYPAGRYDAEVQGVRKQLGCAR
jgi:hypothetical protein